ncbi:MAG: ParB/RepB/Spo0J family partition protein [Candidatus Dormibacteraeota bacterium]|uniref:ParB/RepB/Spo0J family partition protein n=1 Tax=Candidatus Aeolococcus gillhamiae TaxID=3127015 RepID=A0A934K105_9BACT|nr:ParB/RepB/Spo0J family partition protein [Candidatus Dormibacteraeota bacterium]
MGAAFTRRAAAADAVFAGVQLEGHVLDTLQDQVKYRQIPVESIRPNSEQPRHIIDEQGAEFLELVGLIRTQGLIQPIAVVPVDEANREFMLVAGERRWRAYQRLRVEDPRRYGRIPAIIRDPGIGEQDPSVLLMAALTENIGRSDLSDAEKADAITRLRELTSWSVDEVATRMGLNVARVYDLMKMGRHEAVRAAAAAGDLTQGQAVALGRLDDSELANRLISEVQGRSTDDTLEIVRAVKASAAELTAEERIAEAMAVVSAETRRTTDLTRPAPMPLHQEDLAHAEVILLAASPFAALRPRIRSMTRDEVRSMMQAAAEQLEVWPERTQRLD